MLHTIFPLLSAVAQLHHICAEDHRYVTVHPTHHKRIPDSPTREGHGRTPSSVPFDARSASAPPAEPVPASVGPTKTTGLTIAWPAKAHAEDAADKLAFSNCTGVKRSLMGGRQKLIMAVTLDEVAYESDMFQGGRKNKK